MRSYSLVMIGFGNVGQGLAQIIRDQAQSFSDQFGVAFKIIAVCDMLKGSVCNPDGISPDELLQTVAEGKSLEQISAPYHGWDALTTIKKSGADILCEMSYTDLKTGQPAIQHVETAFKAGMHVVTTNKGPIALKYAQLAEMARENHVELGVEGTVMSGTPAVRLGMELLSAAGIQKIQGILNGTTNYILTRMAAGDTYADALAEAQRLGFAEADPTGDVEGFDAAGKVVILAGLLMGAQISMQDVDRQGITSLTSKDIQEAESQGQRWKLIGNLEKNQGKLVASVKPTRVAQTHPLAGVSGATNAITYTTQLLGDVTLIGAGAGRLETGYALIGDMLAIHRHLSAGE